MNTLKQLRIPNANFGIKTIIFDLGNVLIGFDHSIAAQKFSEYSPYKMDEIYQIIFDSKIVSQYEKGEIKTKTFYQKMKHLLKFKLGLGKFLKIWNEIFFQKPEVEKIVKKLRKKFRLILLSNINAAHYSYIRKKFPIVNEFDKTVLSYRVGARKPELKIYELAIKAARCLPEEIIYIDDRIDLVKEARRLKINSLHFKNSVQLRQGLSKFGINTL